MVNSAIRAVQDFLVNLYFERIHLYQLKYMTQRNKLGRVDNGEKAEALKKMDECLEETKKYVKENDLARWRHRLYRFNGKLSEYSGDYKKAVGYYKKSLKFWKSDPEVKAKGLSRNLELEGFLSSALIMSGDAEKGLKMARKVYAKYENTPAGRRLKRNDYTTWAIWRTGVVLFVGRAFLESEAKFGKKEIVDWLCEAEKFLNPPRKVKTWADFQYRRDEILSLKKRLK